MLRIRLNVMSEQAIKDRATLGDADAQFKLAIDSKYGLGCAVQSDVQALWWFEQAAELGHPEAQINMGLAYQNGEGVERDLEKAAYWYGKAVEQGNGMARIALDDVHRRSDNCDAVMRWYKRSIDRVANVARSRVVHTLKSGMSL